MHHVRLFVSMLLVWASLFTPTHAQLETRGSRDAAGLREQMADTGHPVPTLSELSEAYDRASASWLEVFGERPFLLASHAAHRAINALQASGMAPNAYVVVAMLDARGDAAWEEDGYCRAQLNIGSDGSSPVVKALGRGAFEFLAAHELAHCLFDQTSADLKFPPLADLLSPDFPLLLTPAQAQALSSMLVRASSSDGSQGLTDAYDEALADAVAASSLLAFDATFDHVTEHALALRMGAIFLSQRHQVGPPPHLGAYALWTALSAHPARSLPEARMHALRDAANGRFELLKNLKADLR